MNNLKTIHITIFFRIIIINNKTNEKKIKSKYRKKYKK